MSKRPKHVEAPLHVRGESEYVDDVAPPEGMLHAAIYGSPIAHGHIQFLDLSSAEQHPGVVRIITAKDIPGTNVIGPIFQDETSLAEDRVHYIGQPVAVVVAKTAQAARDGARLIKMEVDALPVVVRARDAHEKSQFIGTPRTFALGDVDKAFQDCDVIVEGECEIAGQEHLYLETNRARAVPQEGGRLTVFSSTQSPYSVQKAIGHVLGLPEHLVEIDVRRLGGGFGGKEDQATYWAVLAALAAKCLNRPVELVLNRVDDLVMTGKRHPYSADFKLGLKADGTFVAWDTKLYQNAGAMADLSPAVLERSLFHATNAYFVPNARIYAASCRTNLHPHTAFRGFGGPQAMFVMEAAISAAAEEMNVPREELQRKNLLQRGDTFPYGQTAEEDMAARTWDDAAETFDLSGWRERVDAFNKSNFDHKKGLSVMPVCFGISFTKTHLNQASALIHIYTDGSVSVSNGGIEMGQGLTTNLCTIAAREFGIRLDRVRIESTNTTRVANMSPSAASATTDLNGNATIHACRQIMDRLFRAMAEELDKDDPTEFVFLDEKLFYGDEDTQKTWADVVLHAYLNRIDLSAHGFYATPDIHFDSHTEKGRPFAYHVYGTAITEVTVDCIRGVYDVDTVKLVHNLGRTINPLVDLGQIEGGLAQGIGWMTLEELAYSDGGHLLSHALSTYKAPDVYFSPRVEVKFIEAENPTGPHGSKAVGEPPLMYGIGAYFAIRDALRAHAPRDYAFDAPATPEKVLMDLHRHTLQPTRADSQPVPVDASAGTQPTGE